MRDRTADLEMLDETLRICGQGYYEINGERKNLKLTKDRMQQIKVYLPDDITGLKADISLDSDSMPETACENMDSFAMARNLDAKHLSNKHVLVLNLANAVHPGGGVRRGAHAQEEELCRKSSLLLSLESKTAKRYYDYNWSIHTFLGSDAVMITPEVEIIRDEKGHLLADSTVVSVMTCAAPNIRNGMEGMTDSAYKAMLYNRITAMLAVAASEGYEVMVLGAFGCGAFRNDANTVAGLFHKAIKGFSYKGKSSGELFRMISFAVLDRGWHDYYNFNSFDRYFG